jgi:hypothetical protein
MMALTPTREHTIYRLAADLMAALPPGATGDADRDRIDRAIDLVETVERTASPSVYLVRSASTPDAAYRVQSNLCNCPDTPRERGAACCKHAYAVQLLNRLERAETDAEQRLPIAGGCELLPRPTRQELEAQMDPATLLFTCDQCGVRTNHVAIVGLARGGSIALCLTCQRPPITGGRAPLTVHVDPEDSILDLWPTDGEPCALPPQCRRCQAEPACPRHPDGLGKVCIMNELYGEEV